MGLRVLPDAVVAVALHLILEMAVQAALGPQQVGMGLRALQDFLEVAAVVPEQPAPVVRVGEVCLLTVVLLEHIPLLQLGRVKRLHLLC